MPPPIWPHSNWSPPSLKEWLAHWFNGLMMVGAVLGLTLAVLKIFAWVVG